MARIASQWTGRGLAPGTAITATNVNDPGNGDTVTRGISGSPSFVTAGDGFRVTTATASDLAFINGPLTPSACLLGQVVLTEGGALSADVQLAGARTSSASIGQIALAVDRRVGIRTANNVPGTFSPALGVGDRVLIDFVFAQHTTPTASNGRIFYRVTNLTDPTWNTTGEFFHDTGYTQNLGTAPFELIRYGKQNNSTLPAPGALFEFLGWQPIVVSVTDTSQAAAEAYFADAPGVVPATPSPVVLYDGNEFVDLDVYSYDGAAFVPVEAP